MNEELLKAIATLVAYAQQQPTNAAMAGDSETQLGFCDPPKLGGGTAIYIDDEEGLFYEFHSDRPKREQRQFIEKRGLACRITGLRLATKEYKGKDNLKLRLDVIADKPLMLEKALATNFGRGLIFSLARLGAAVKNIVTIEISVPANLSEKTCFCNIYDASGQRVTQQSRYAADEVELDKIQFASNEVSRILQEKKTTPKSQIEVLEKLQAEEEAILSGLVELIQNNLR